MGQATQKGAHQSRYSITIRKTFELGMPVDKWMLEKLDEELGSVKCPQCGNGAPTQYGRQCICQGCGHRWELSNPLNPKALVRYMLSDGTILFWNEFKGLWVNDQAGEPYPPGPRRVARLLGSPEKTPHERFKVSPPRCLEHRPLGYASSASPESPRWIPLLTK